MSFALKVKEEIILHSFNFEQKIAFLSGFIKNNGELVFDSQMMSLRLTTISNKIARKLISFIKEFFSGQLEIAILQTQALKKNKTFQLTLKGELEPFFYLLAIDPDQTQTQSPYWLKSWPSEVFRAYIAGLFVAVGSVNAPTTSNYHLEFQFKSLPEAQHFALMIKKWDFDFKILERPHQKYLCYLKKATAVSDFIKFLDAPQCVLDFENQRISRDLVNNINRIQNIDISNQTKTLMTSEKQIIMIEKLIENKHFAKLSPKAQILATCRLKYPDASYRELSQKLKKNGHEISKSGISNLFKQIAKYFS